MSEVKSEAKTSRKGEGMKLDLALAYPRALRKHLVKSIKYSTAEAHPHPFMARMLVMSLLVAIIGALLAQQYYADTGYTVLAFAGMFLLCHLTFYAWLVLSADSKASFVDSILPDALRLIASNLRSGLTVDKALLRSAREEFGPLKDAIDTAGKRVATGDDERTSFLSMLDKIKSENLERAVDLIIQGIRSGGQMAAILDRIADVFRDRSMLDKEMRSSVLMYAIFIFFVLGLGAPVLFGISDYLVRTTSSGIGGQIPQISGDVMIVGAPISVLPKSGAGISPDFMTNYFMVALVISSLSGSIVLGQVLSGKEKAGLKFIPMLLVLSITLFFAIKYVLSITLGAILT